MDYLAQAYACLAAEYKRKVALALRAFELADLAARARFVGTHAASTAATLSFMSQRCWDELSDDDQPSLDPTPTGLGCVLAVTEILRRERARK